MRESFQRIPHDYLTLVLEFIDGGDLERWIMVKIQLQDVFRDDLNLDEDSPHAAADLRDRYLVHLQSDRQRCRLHPREPRHPQRYGAILAMLEGITSFSDLKPANVLLTRNYQVKLTDFGLSRVQNRNTGAKTVCGTPYYMAPERIAEIGYSYKSDIWSLGCILYEVGSPIEYYQRDSTISDGRNEISVQWREGQHLFADPED
jgi:serine/threonine protein kinase